MQLCCPRKKERKKEISNAASGWFLRGCPTPSATAAGRPLPLALASREVAAARYAVYRRAPRSSEPVNARRCPRARLAAVHPNAHVSSSHHRRHARRLHRLRAEALGASRRANFYP